MQGRFRVLWNNTPILELNHVAFKGSRSISYSALYRDIGRVARYWGIDPDDFPDLPRQKRLNMITIYELEQRIGLMQDYEQRVEQERRANAAKHKGKGKRR